MLDAVLHTIPGVLKMNNKEIKKNPNNRKKGKAVKFWKLTSKVDEVLNTLKEDIKTLKEDKED